MSAGSAALREAPRACAAALASGTVDDRDRRWVDDMPHAYQRYLAPTLFQPFAVDLARRVRSRRPRRVLELAAGTGVLTRELVAILAPGVLVATDLNPAMVEFGGRQVPD